MLCTSELQSTIHQQSCELHVQTAAYAASTNVGEICRSCRTPCLSTIFRLYHQWALEIYQKKRDEENAELAAEGKELKMKKVDRVSGSLRMKTLAEYADKFTERLDDIMGQVTKEMYEKVYQIVGTLDCKVSTDLKEATKTKYAQRVQ